MCSLCHIHVYAIMHFEKLPVLSQVFPVYFYTITQWLVPLLTRGSRSCTKLALKTLHFKIPAMYQHNNMFKWSRSCLGSQVVALGPKLHQDNCYYQVDYFIVVLNLTNHDWNFFEKNLCCFCTNTLLEFLRIVFKPYSNIQIIQSEIYFHFSSASVFELKHYC